MDDAAPYWRGTLDKFTAETGGRTCRRICLSGQYGEPQGIVRFLGCSRQGRPAAKTVLYTLNPADNAVLATLTGSFGLDRVQKLQFGPAWWYNDHKHGIEENIAALSSYSILANSIGMTTDSRTILSFSRHEYFRRVLCNYLGEMMKNGELPDDTEFVGRTVLDISYRNAEKWIYNE